MILEVLIALFIFFVVLPAAAGFLGELVGWLFGGAAIVGAIALFVWGGSALLTLFAELVPHMGWAGILAILTVSGVGILFASWLGSSPRPREHRLPTIRPTVSIARESDSDDRDHDDADLEEADFVSDGVRAEYLRHGWSEISPGYFSPPSVRKIQGEGQRGGGQGGCSPAHGRRSVMPT